MPCYVEYAGYRRKSASISWQHQYQQSAALLKISSIVLAIITDAPALLEARSHHEHSQANISTLAGCTCESSWTVNNETCLDGSTVFHGCSMATPCDGDNNGQCGLSWCVIADPASCTSPPAGRDWDYCRAPPQLLLEPMWIGPYVNTRPLAGVCNASSVVVSKSMTTSDCQRACVEQSGCNTIMYNGTCTLLNCGLSGNALATGEVASGVDSYSVMTHSECCEDPNGSPCQFPYEFGGDLYTNCTPITRDGSPYCPIKRNQYQVQQWGSCRCTAITQLPWSTTTVSTTVQRGNATTIPEPSTTPNTQPTTRVSNRTHKGGGTLPTTAAPKRTTIWHTSQRTTSVDPNQNDNHKTPKSLLGISMMWTIIVSCVIVFVVLVLVGLTIIRRSSKRRIVTLEMNDMEDDDDAMLHDDDAHDTNDGDAPDHRKHARSSEPVATGHHWPRLWSWFSMGTPTRGKYVSLNANNDADRPQRQPRSSKTLRDVLAEHEPHQTGVGITIPRRSGGVVVEVDGTPIGSFGSYDGYEGVGSGSASVLSSSPSSQEMSGALRTPPLMGPDNSIDFATKKLEGYRRAVRMSLSPQHGTQDTTASMDHSPGRLSPALSVASAEAYHHHGTSGGGLLSALGAGVMPSKNWRTVRAAINTGVLRGDSDVAAGASVLPPGGKIKARAKRLAAARQWDMLATVIQGNMGRKTLQDVLAGATPPYSNSSGLMGGSSRGGHGRGAWPRSGRSSVGSGGSTGGGDASLPVDMTLVSRLLREEVAKQGGHPSTATPARTAQEPHTDHEEECEEDYTYLQGHACSHPGSRQGSSCGPESVVCDNDTSTVETVGAETRPVESGRHVVLRDVLAGACEMVSGGGLQASHVALATKSPTAIEYLHENMTCEGALVQMQRAGSPEGGFLLFQEIPGPLDTRPTYGVVIVAKSKPLLFRFAHSPKKGAMERLDTGQLLGADMSTAVSTLLVECGVSVHLPVFVSSE
eukprot:m.203615 g.203615  ORF g.203615 m.203615 type:complete len:978 (-) comp18855_c0_seq1:362-3295(-)